MARKVVLVTDAGIDEAFASVLALNDPDLEVLGLAATAGNVTAEAATRNVHVLVEQTDPPRWPRLGAALPVTYEMDAVNLHGAGGLGGVEFPCAQLHHPHPADKLISDLVRQYPHEIAIVLMGPATVFARAIDRDPDVASLVERIVFVGGSWHEPGDASAVAEFHFYLDPVAARQVLRCGAPVTLLPLDVTRKVVFSPADLLQMPWPHTSAHQFLRRIVPFGIGSTSSLFGVEGLYLHDVLALLPLTQAGIISSRPVYADVETRGELTRGQSIFDVRWNCKEKPNIDLAVGIDVPAAREYIARTLQRIGEEE